jgi:uncharacterized protein YegP (UPF0339 family)
MRLRRRRASPRQRPLSEIDGMRAKGELGGVGLTTQSMQEERPMAHKFQIKKNKAGEFVAYFVYNSETIFWTEGYSSKASAKNAIESIKKNGPDAEIDDQTD